MKHITILVIHYALIVAISNARYLFVKINEFLESNRLSVNEVMYEVEYNDPKAFRDVFKKEVGVSPLVYRSKCSL